MNNIDRLNMEGFGKFFFQYLLNLLSPLYELLNVFYFIFYRQVIVQKLALIVDGRPDTELDLTQDLKEIAKKKFVIKEGIKFRIRIDFVVQREIVTGLRYVQKTSRLGMTVDKMKYMVGSYAPKATPHSYTTPYEDAPTGMAGRGSYHVTSFFTDDDQNSHLKWEWAIEVKKDWAEQ